MICHRHGKGHCWCENRVCSEFFSFEGHRAYEPAILKGLIEYSSIFGPDESLRMADYSIYQERWVAELCTMVGMFCVGRRLLWRLEGEMGPLSFHTTQNVFCTRPT